MMEVIQTLEARAWRNLYFEQLDGGVAGRDVTALMDSLVSYQHLLAKLYKEQSPGTPGGDKVTIEGSDVLAKIFGPQNVTDIPAEKHKTIDAVEELPQEPNPITSTEHKLPKQRAGSKLAQSLKKMLKEKEGGTPPFNES